MKSVPTCRIPCVGIRYTSCGISDSALRRIFDSTKEFRILRGVSSHVLDHPSVFKIDKILCSRLVCLSCDSLSVLTPGTCFSSLAPFSDYIC